MLISKQTILCAILICELVGISAKTNRYLLYDVNPPEGFNLRRDVYMRMANLVRLMRQHDPSWILVLPPFTNLYHWKTMMDQEKLPWSKFFDVPSLRKLVPVVEFKEFMTAIKEERQIDDTPPLRLIDQYYELQQDKQFFTTGEWREGVTPDICQDDPEIRLIQGVYRGIFYGYTDIAAVKFSCVTASADIDVFDKWMSSGAVDSQVVMLGHAEVLIHGKYSEWSAEWWEARRSMRYSKDLVEIADRYRLEVLNSTDESDNTVLPADWRTTRPEPGSALGGPYVCVHWRRADYVVAYFDKSPGPGPAARQLKKWLNSVSLSTVYLSTDANGMEVLRFSKLLEQEDFKVYRYQPDRGTLLKIGDGGNAIVDQIICSHAHLFIGSYTSTFSFRIQEDRSIMGFSPEMTFNRLHGDNETNPEPPTKWEVIYPSQVDSTSKSHAGHEEL